ncbi:MAG: hypothetical protein ACF8NJ_06000 [Phycisphaerales bacterium JB038]
MIDRQITLTARRRLGDTMGGLLLPPPPAKAVQGGIELGSVVYAAGKRRPAGLAPSEFLQGVTILGRSGAGKTNAAFVLLEQLSRRRIPWLFLDWKRTGRHLLPLLPKPPPVYTPGRSLLPLAFNPFEPPPGLEPAVFAHHVVDVMGDSFTLGDGAKSLLLRVIKEQLDDSTVPTTTSISERLEALPVRNREHGWRISALRALGSLSASSIGEANQSHQDLFATQLLKRGAIIELDSLSVSARKFLAPLLCLWLFYAKLATNRRETLDYVILIEEAHHLLYRGASRAKEGLLNTLLRQFRELGTGVIVVDQHAHLLSSAALGNAYTTVVFNQKDPADVAKAASICGLDDEDRGHLSRLPVGDSVVRLQDRWTRPFLVRWPLLPVRKGSVSDADLLRGLFASPGESAGTAGTARDEAESEEVRQGREADHGLIHGEMAFLADVATHPWDGVKARYRRLGLSGHKGTLMYRRLVRLGWLESETAQHGTTRLRLLRLTTRARRLLNLPEAEGAGGRRRESIAHEYWKNWYASQLREQGFSVQIEAPRVGGRVDVLAEKDGKRIGIEIETGKSDAKGNAEKCLASGFDEVWVVLVGLASSFAPSSRGSGHAHSLRAGPWQSRWSKKL